MIVWLEKCYIKIFFVEAKQITLHKVKRYRGQATLSRRFFLGTITFHMMISQIG